MTRIQSLRPFATFGVALVVALLMTGCEGDPPPVENVNLHLTPSHQTIFTGERVTVEAHAHGVTGHPTDVKWRTTGGQLTEVSNDTVQVQFNDPGTYRIHGQLFVDQKLVSSSHVDIRVRSID